MRRWALLLAFLLAVAAGASVYWRIGPLMHGAEAQDAAQPRRERNSGIPVVLAQAKRMTLPVVCSTICSIQLVPSIAVTSQVSGIVSQVNVADGAEVKEGDVLITLDARLIDTQIEEGQAPM